MSDPACHPHDNATEAEISAGTVARPAGSTVAADGASGRRAQTDGVHTGHVHTGDFHTGHLHASHPAIVARLKRAEGHLRKIIAMFGDGRPCVDLAQQLHAVEAAIGAAKHELIHDHIEHCLAMPEDGAPEDGASPRAVLAELKAITKYL